MSSAPSIPGVRPFARVPHAALWVCFITLCWGLVSVAGARSAFAELGPLPIPLPVVAVLSIFSKAVGVLCEAAFYWTWWAASGARVRFVPLALWIASASLVDVGSECVRLVAVASPDVAAPLALLAGGQAARELMEDWPSVMRFAFGATGLLTLVRIAITARGQARETGHRLRGPLGLTATVYVTSRVLMALFIDALRGGSPL